MSSRSSVDGAPALSREVMVSFPLGSLWHTLTSARRVDHFNFSYVSFSRKERDSA